jgi:serine/threonine protein phosphatase PrpC
MIYLDSYYRIGISHQVCQDYALTNHDKLPFVIVSDGCSSSNDTDIGARIISHVARKNLLNNSEIHYHEFGKKVIQDANKIVNSMDLSSEVLNATLLVGFLHKQIIHVLVYGDGCILLKDYNGNIVTIQIDFNENMPYYLSYWLNKKYNQAYKKHFKNHEILNIKYSDNSSDKVINFAEPLHFKFPITKYSTVGIASDGITQFHDMCINYKLPVNQITTHFMDFPHKETGFVQAVVDKTLQHYINNEIYYLDDIALGILAV